MAGDDITLPFSMVGCRKSCKILGDPERMDQMINVIEENIDTKPSLIFDGCKALIEYTCKTILRNTNSGYEDSWNLPKFIKETTKIVRLTPIGYEGDSIATPIFTNITSGLATVVQNFGELRSKEGLLAHGALGYAQQLQAIHARFAASSTDALIELLVFSSTEYWSNIEVVGYDDNETLNQLIDDSLMVSDNGDGYIELLSSDGTELLKFKKSDLIYRLDKDQYINLLKEILPQEEMLPENTDEGRA